MSREARRAPRPTTTPPLARRSASMSVDEVARATRASAAPLGRQVLARHATLDRVRIAEVVDATPRLLEDPRDARLDDRRRPARHDQRRRTPSASATAVTCAKYAISPGPPTYAAVGRMRALEDRAQQHRRRQRTRRAARRTLRPRVIGSRRFVPSAFKNTSESPATSSTCG